MQGQTTLNPLPSLSEEARLLGDCYAVLLANIRRNRAKRLAHSMAQSALLKMGVDESVQPEKALMQQLPVTQDKV